MLGTIDASMSECGHLVAIKFMISEPNNYFAACDILCIIQMG